MHNDIAYLHKFNVNFIGCKLSKLQFCFEKPHYKGNVYTLKFKIKSSHIWAKYEEEIFIKDFFKRIVNTLGLITIYKWITGPICVKHTNFFTTFNRFNLKHFKIKAVVYSLKQYSIRQWAVHNHFSWCFETTVKPFFRS